MTQQPTFAALDIEALVRAASGRFIYAATVIRFISERRSSPVNKLNAVLTWTSGENQRSNPFAALNLLYTSIIFKAKEAYEAAKTTGRDFLLLCTPIDSTSIEIPTTLFKI
ncbi:hypothetical protein H1R20_g14662, partial [Candolleomyces eurysporus]